MCENSPLAQFLGGNVNCGKWFPLSWEDMPGLASQAVGAALGAAAVCCCSSGFSADQRLLGTFWTLASILAKAASPALPWTESRVPWPLSLENKESDYQREQAVFTKDVGTVCLVQWDQNLDSVQIMWGFFPPDLNALFSSGWFCSVAWEVSSLT